MIARSDIPVTVRSAHAATAEWLAARKAWWAHLFGCEACRKYHRQPVGRRGPHPCEIGEGLVMKYNETQMWVRK